jgi:UDP-N-acetylglucosamine--N-acetylmuramyl-(pentapeptide) pyrophosphoryl-undecaprenol N-acetylglucosamine transferase
MTVPPIKNPFVAIACGGTGGHLFPGLAVAEELKKRGCRIALLISAKDIDQQAAKFALGMEIFTLPAVALQNKNYFSFAKSFWNSFRAARKVFNQCKPDAVLAMGGFTSAPPILAARKYGAKTFLHESNTIPGRANRYLARFVNEAFVGFPESLPRLRAKKVSVTGTPVRPQFQPRNVANCRATLGLEPNRPTVLVMGGSQGASGINELILKSLINLATDTPEIQWLHLTGSGDQERVIKAYEHLKQILVVKKAASLPSLSLQEAEARLRFKFVVKPFCNEMELALGAATMAVSRSGASSLAEIAAMRLPSLLVPYPAAADNHQFFNALAFEKTGAARLIEQKNCTPEKIAALLRDLIQDSAAREKIQSALAQWHAPEAAQKIAENILSAIARQPEKTVPTKMEKCGCGHTHGPAKHAH